jgi:4-hydroxybenzoyl-CoA reductase subunit alpha
MSDFQIIGKRIPRPDGRAMVTGRLKYINDIYLPGMLYGKILRSPHAHAKIVKIDTSEAERLPGVKAVITAEDTPKVKFQTSYYGVKDEYALAVDKVRYVGEPVAAVAAVDEDTAERALDLIKVEYQELPAVFDVMEAMQPGAPKIHEVKNNVAAHIFHEAGDVEKGFKQADLVREDRFKAPMVVNATIGTRCAVADFCPESGELTIYSDTQKPYNLKPSLASILGLSPDKVRVIRPYVPGAFGGRAGISDVQTIAGFLSIKSRRPVRVEHTRDEEFSVQRGRQAVILDFKTGVKKNGKLVALFCRHYTNAGAYVDFGIQNTLQNVNVLDLCLRVPNVKFEGYVVYTNTLPGCPFRGLLNNSFTWGLYSHMDMVAEELGMDFPDFLLKNARKKGDVTTTRVKLGSCGIAECIKAVVEASGWKTKKGKLPPNHGIGLAIAGHTAGFHSFIGELSTVLVSVDEYGKVTVLSGRGEYGNAPTTLICMVVAEELGLRMEDIFINDAVDTKTVPWEDGNYGSRGTVSQGRAAMAAARDVKKQLFRAIAKKLGVSVNSLEAKNSRIIVKGKKTELTFQEAVKIYADLGNKLPLIGRGHYSPPSEDWDIKSGVGNVAAAWGFGAQVVEVEVDPETGEVKVLEVFTADDCGRAINPLHLEGSSEGGVVMGLGSALFEGVRYDERGRVITRTFPTYGFPTVMQAPKKIEHRWIETIDPYGPYGAKGITEVVMLPTAAAITNAVYDAVKVRIKEAPLTAERIRNALKEKGSLKE